MSKNDWFQKMSDIERQKYCGEHPRSKICKLYFGGKAGIEKKGPTVAESFNNKEALGPSKQVTVEEITTNFDEDLSESETPKTEAKTREEEYYDVGTQYEWAKKSSVQNLGEDVKGSARHTRNKDRDWGTLQDMAKNEDFNKKQLMALYEPNPENVPDEFAPAYYVIRDILRAYPAYNPDVASMKMYLTNNKSTVEKDEWITTYQELWEAGKQIAESERNPIVVAAKFREYLKGIFQNNTLRMKHPMYGDFLNYGMYSSQNNKNGTLQKILRPFLTSLSERDIARISDGRNPDLAKSVFGELESEDFCKKMKAVLNGEPISKAFGVETKAKSMPYNPADLYKKVIKVREGGREILNYDQCAEFFMKEMGARAVQYGNSLKDSERFFHAKTTAEAMSDMADALDIPVKSLSLDGRFAIGFGSRGTKGSLATYHPTHEILNMNKDAEYGALAHEFGHAIGYQLSAIALSKHTNLPKKKYCISEIRNDLVRDQPFANFQRRFKEANSKILRRMRNDDGYKSADKKERAWAMSQVEGFARAWESYVARKLEKKGMKNTYLVAGFSDWKWPTKEELDEVEPIFDELLDTYFRKER
jgi:hypothetical protein